MLCNNTRRKSVGANKAADGQEWENITERIDLMASAIILIYYSAEFWTLSINNFSNCKMERKQSLREKDFVRANGAKESKTASVCLSY